MNATVEEVENTRLTVDRIIDLADPIFSDSSSEESVEGAVTAIEKLVDDAVTQRTEALRGALMAMLRNHSYRFPINGRCYCDACQVAEGLVGGNN